MRPCAVSTRWLNAEIAVAGRRIEAQASWRQFSRRREPVRMPGHGGERLGMGAGLLQREPQTAHPSWRRSGLRRTSLSNLRAGHRRRSGYVKRHRFSLRENTVTDWGSGVGNRRSRGHALRNPERERCAVLRPPALNLDSCHPCLIIAKSANTRQAAQMPSAAHIIAEPADLVLPPGRRDLVSPCASSLRSRSISADFCLQLGQSPVVSAALVVSCRG